MSTTQADNTAVTLSSRLRNETWEMHQEAENGALARSLVQGDVSREAFLGLVEREHRLHDAIDGMIGEARGGHAALGAIAPDGFEHAAEYAADVRTLGGDVSLGDTAAVRDAVGAIRGGAADAPAFLIGVHYVREGAKNGNRMIEPRVRAAVGGGTTHLDPEGEAQRPNWMRFKETLDGLELSKSEADAAVAGAVVMFRSIRDIHAEVLRENG